MSEQKRVEYESPSSINDRYFEAGTPLRDYFAAKVRENLMHYWGTAEDYEAAKARARERNK